MLMTLSAAGRAVGGDKPAREDSARKLPVGGGNVDALFAQMAPFRERDMGFRVHACAGGAAGRGLGEQPAPARVARAAEQRLDVRSRGGFELVAHDVYVENLGRGEQAT